MLHPATDELDMAMVAVVIILLFTGVKLPPPSVTNEGLPCPI